MLGSKHRPRGANGSDSSRSLWSDDRGQTLQDYVLGVSLFLVTVLVIVGTILPTVTAPFDQEVGGDKISQADRVAETIVTNASERAGTNRLDVAVVESIAGKDTATLRDRFGLPETSWINVSVAPLNGSGVHRSASGTALATNADPSGDTAASARIVTLSDDSCATACRLVVRVW